MIWRCSIPPTPIHNYQVLNLAWCKERFLREPLFFLCLCQGVFVRSPEYDVTLLES